MKQITIPDWFKSLPGDAMLNSMDMAKLFDIKNVHHGLKTGLLPQPSKISFKFYHNNNMWKVSDLREHFKQLGATK